jgi:hypothetical protein
MSTRGQRKIEGGPFVRSALRPHAAAVAVDDALDQGQADPRPFILFGAVEALKHVEELVVILRNLFIMYQSHPVTEYDLNVEQRGVR